MQNRNFLLHSFNCKYDKKSDYWIKFHNKMCVCHVICISWYLPQQKIYHRAFSRKKQKSHFKTETNQDSCDLISRLYFSQQSSTGSLNQIFYILSRKFSIIAPKMFEPVLQNLFATTELFLHKMFTN